MAGTSGRLGVDPTPPGRIDYYDDPDAPKAGALVPSVNVVVADGVGYILLIQRTDNGNWALPGPVIAHSIPVSSSVSRAAAWATDSPRSIASRRPSSPAT
jgi:hypothetical protein